jgi:predicted NAD/FAD-binding protein
MGAIIEDTEKKLPYDECPKFNTIILQREIVGSPRAITMNKDIIAMIGEYLEGDDETKQNLQTHSDYLFLEKDEVVKKFYQWLHGNGYYQGILNSGGYVEVVNSITHPLINKDTIPITINVAGKNFATFDKLFLEQLPWWKN